MVWQSLLQSWLRSRAQQAAFRAAMRAAGTAEEKAIPAQVDVAVIAALNIELGGLADRLTGMVTTQADGFKTHRGVWRDRGLLLVESGVGRQRAARATSAVIDGHHPSWVISTGFAGGLAAAIARRDIIVGNAVANEAGERLAIDLKLDPAGRRGLHVGRILTVDRIIRTPEEKRTLAARHDAVAVDMESFAVAEVCRHERTRCIVVRVISDAVDDTLPADVERLIHRPSTAGKLGAAASAIVRRPGSVKDFWQLKEQALLATDRLAEFLLGVLEQLPKDQTPEKPSSEPAIQPDA